MNKKNDLSNIINQAFEEIKEDSISSKDLTTEHPDVVKYLCDLHNISKIEIQLIYIDVVGEIAIYCKKQFIGYLDNFFYNDMDRYYND